MKALHRGMAALVAACALSAPIAHVQAQAWPSRPVRLVIGLPPGGGGDPLARAFAQSMSNAWGQPVLVDNKPGANTMVATDAVAKSAPDGYTLLFALDVGITVNPHLYAKVPYDPIRDLTPITQTNTFATVLVAHPSLAANNIAELIALARAQPEKITYSSMGAGSQMHMLTEMLGNKAGVKFVHVPYKGIPQMTAAVLAGEVGFTWVGVFTTRPMVAAGRLKAIGYGAGKRSRFLPDLQTFAEAGFPDVDMPVWFGIMGPAGMARPLVDKIHRDVAAIVADPEFRDRQLLNRAYEPSGLGPDEFAALIKREFAVRADLVRVSGARVE